MCASSSIRSSHHPATGEEARERLIATMPVTELGLTLSGVETPVLEGGEGSPLVLLHGPGEYAAKWFTVIPALVGSHRVVAPDLPGHGRSVASEGAIDADRVLDWLDALIDATCCEPPTLVGQTLGGAIAARYAGRSGARLGRLVLCDSLGLTDFAPAPAFERALAAYMARPDNKTHDALWRHCALDLGRLSAGLGESWDLMRAYAIDRANAAELRHTWNALMEEFGLPAIPSEELERIAVPTALIWGREDRAIPLAAAEAASARYGWPLHIVEDAADDPAIEQPTDFVRALRRALLTS